MTAARSHVALGLAEQQHVDSLTTATWWGGRITSESAPQNSNQMAQDTAATIHAMREGSRRTPRHLALTKHGDLNTEAQVACVAVMQEGCGGSNMWNWRRLQIGPCRTNAALFLTSTILSRHATRAVLENDRRHTRSACASKDRRGFTDVCILPSPDVANVTPTIVNNSACVASSRGREPFAEEVRSD